jgi:hypothetical protein
MFVSSQKQSQGIQSNLLEKIQDILKKLSCDNMFKSFAPSLYHFLE